MFYAAACFRTSFLFSFPSGRTICIGLPCVLCSVAPVMSNSLWPYGLQPTSFLCPWEYPGKHIRVGCHVLLQGLSLPRDCACVSRIASRFFTTEPPGKPMLNCCVTFIYSLISWLFLGFFSLSFFFSSTSSFSVHLLFLSESPHEIPYWYLICQLDHMLSLSQLPADRNGIIMIGLDKHSSCVFSCSQTQ